MGKTIVIIPARSGSKRIKNKNLNFFFGKPIINYSIDLAKKSKLFDIIHISTDSTECAKLVEKQGLKIDFMRPKSLSSDNTPILDVLKYVVNRYQKSKIKIDTVVLLYACNPLISLIDLNKGMKLLDKYKNKFPVMPVLKFSPSIEWSLNLKKDKLKFINIKKLNLKTQKLNNYYHDSGSFLIFPIKYMKYDSVEDYANKFIGFEISKFNSVDIDEKKDLELAKALFYYKKNKILK